jgi:hypothetical protein
MQQLMIVPTRAVDPPDSEATWQERGLCSQTDPEAFFPEKGGSTREAKRVCMSCDVRVQCLESDVTAARLGIALREPYCDDVHLTPDSTGTGPHGTILDVFECGHVRATRYDDPDDPEIPRVVGWFDGTRS